MAFTDEAWISVAVIRDGIDRLPFLTALEDGSLSPARFDYYLQQDALYLSVFARVLATAAARSARSEDLTFWTGSASNTLVVERQLHEKHIGDADGISMSPTCTAYTSYLLSLAGWASYPVLVAGVLPCFWIYEDTGRRLRDRVRDVSGHPYGDWIATYGDADFAAATAHARAVVDSAAETADSGELEQMMTAFITASRYEYLFWDAAWRQERWPL